MPDILVADEFRNPEKKPLCDLLFDVDEDGVTIKVPALDKRWVRPRVFSTYIGMVVSGGKLKRGADLEEWIHEADWFQKDMEFLLHLRHHEFWSYMVYETSALAAIVSFLQRANPFYMDICYQTEDPSVMNLYEAIRNSVIRIVCRLITNRESPEAWITKEHLRELIYTNFLISIPMLLDLIVAVGDSDEHNLLVLSRIFETVFSLEPKYRKDLTTGLSFFKTAFRTIQTQSENEGFDGAGGGVADDNLDTPYDDVVLYTLDAAYTLSILLEVCPDVCTICYELQLGQSIAQFYDNTIPYLYKNIFLINEQAYSLRWLNIARVQLLKAFRSISNSYIMSVIMNPQESLIPSESFVGLLTECLSERTFVIDYQREYPVEVDMDILRQACKELDNFKADFVTKGYQQEAKPRQPVKSTVKNIASNGVENRDIKAVVKRSEINGHKVCSNQTVQPPRTRDLDLEVSAALDILPYLGTGFLRRVLQRYDNSDDAIAAILEENLPPDLVNTDQTEIYIPPDPQDILYNQTGVKHFNVHDGDSYDVMTQDNPSCIIKQGKGFPNAPKNASELLDDKRDLQSLKHRYQEYSMVTVDVCDDGEYEDEYDDSYEALLESETRVVRSKQLNAGLADVQDVSEEESDGSDEDVSENRVDAKETNGRREKRLDFCENPEAVRARYEAKRAFEGNRGKGGGFRKQSAHDVVGAAKGHGQSKDTQQSRNKKEVHKSSRANHNRKAGAAFKRSKGMMA